MRIIAGTARSLPLKTIEGQDTRPTTDRIKETLFNILQPNLYNCYFLDLFSGSGQIGLEAISRGGAFSVFVENNRKAVDCIQSNITFTKFDSQCKVFSMDVISAMRSMEGKYQFDYIFMDPPYKMGMEKDVLTYLATSGLANKDTTIITEAVLDTEFDYLDELGLETVRKKEYKTNLHMFIKKKN